MSFTEAVKSVFSKYATFSGRARRSEYWYFTLFNVVVTLILGAIFGSKKNSFGNTITEIYSCAVLLPSLAVTWRRLHDIGKPGTNAIMPYVSFVVSSVLVAFGVMTSSELTIIIAAVAMIASLVLLIRLFLLLIKDGQPGANEYGPNPKEPTAAGNQTAYTAPASEDKSYAFQRDDSPMDEIQAAVEGKGDNGKVSLWGEENSIVPPAPDNPQSGMSFCKSCGALMNQGETFCTNCGAKR